MMQRLRIYGLSLRSKFMNVVRSYRYECIEFERHDSIYQIQVIAVFNSHFDVL